MTRDPLRVKGEDCGMLAVIADAWRRPLPGQAGWSESFNEVCTQVAAVFFNGRGSFEASWLRCENIGPAVLRVVDALVLAAEMEAPVVIEAAGGDEGAVPDPGRDLPGVPQRTLRPGSSSSLLVRYVPAHHRDLLPPAGRRQGGNHK